MWKEIEICPIICQTLGKGKRCLLVCWWKCEKLVWPGGKWIAWQRGVLEGLGMKELCMMPCHSCYVYSIWRSKEVGMGRGFKVIIWGASHKGRRPIFMGGVEPSRHHVSGQVFGLILSFLSNRWLWVVLDGKSLQEYPVNGEVLQDSILGSTLFLLCINGLLNNFCYL